MSYELVEVYNRITWRTRKEYRVGDRFEYVGAVQDRPVFEYMLADQDYGLETFAEIKKLVDVYRKEVRSLAGIRQAKVVIKRKKADYFGSAFNYITWNYFIRFETAFAPSDQDLLRDIGLYWMCTHGKFYNMSAQSTFGFRNYDRKLRLLRLRGTASESFTAKRGGPSGLVDYLVGFMLPYVRPYFDVQFIEFDIKFTPQDKIIRFAGFSDEPLLEIGEVG